MKRILAAITILTLCSCVPAFAAEFDAEARLKDVQARFATNRERVSLLNAEAAAMQREAEALQEILRLTAPPVEKPAEKPAEEESPK